VAEIFVGSVSVGVVPNAREFNKKIREQLFPDADNIGREYGAKLGRGIQESVRVYTERIKEELKHGFTVNVDADTTKAKDEIDAARTEEEARPVKLRVHADENSLRRFGAMLGAKVRQGFGNLALGGLAGGGLFTAGAAGLAAAGPLAAAAAGIAGFAAIAIPEITKVSEAMKKTGAAGQKAWQQLTPQEREIGRSFKGVEKAFHDIQKAVAPAVDHIVSMGADLAKDFMPSLGRLAQVGAKVIGDFIRPLDRWISSPGFRQLGKQFGEFAVQAAKLVGPWLVQLLKAFAQLFLQLLPSGIRILRVLLPLIVQLITYLTPGIVIMAQLAASTLEWLQANHLLLPVLAGILALVVIIVGPTGIGGIIAAVVLVGLAITFFAKNWHRIWTDIKNWAMDAWNFLTHGWGQLLIPGLTAIRWAVQFVRDHWKQAWNDIKGFTATLWHFIGPLFKIGFDLITGYIDFLVWAFRTAFHIVSVVAQWLWGILVRGIQGWWSAVKPVVDAFGKAFEFVFKNIIMPVAKFVWGRVVDFIKTAMEIGKTVVRTFVNVVLTVLGWIVHAAASAFGWVPGLGGKLKDAAHQFDIFKSRVNNALNGINGRNVKVGVNFVSAMGSGGVGFVQGGPGRRATGGMITGPGTWTSDTAGLYALSNDEWVIRASSASMYGYNAMDAVNRGTAVIRYARGGPVGSGLFGDPGGTGKGVNVRPDLPTSAQINKDLLAAIRALASHFATAIGNLGIVKFAEQFVGRVPYVWGGTTTAGWDCSGFTGFVYHHFGYNPPRTAAEQFGWVRRTGPTPGALAFFSGADGSVGAPGHVGIVIGPNRMVDAYGTGYGTRFDSIIGSSGAVAGFGIPPGGFDQGGWLTPGWNLNMLRKPEPVLTPGQWDAVYSAASNGDNGTHYHAHFDGLTYRMIHSEVATAFKVMEMSQGRQLRAMRRS